MSQTKSKPVRVQLRRTKGWRMPENTVKVDRTTIFGNPWTVVEMLDSGLFSRDPAKRSLLAQQCVDEYRRWLKGPEIPGSRHTELKMLRRAILDRLPELRGKNLGCWCRDGEPCHAAVLLEMANSDAPALCSRTGGERGKDA